MEGSTGSWQWSAGRVRYVLLWDAHGPRDLDLVEGLFCTWSTHDLPSICILYQYGLLKINDLKTRRRFGSRVWCQKGP